MRALAFALLLSGTQDAPKDCCEGGVPKAWAGYNRGVKWTKPFDGAVEQARKEGKLLMVFHLVGDMDKEGC